MKNGKFLILTLFENTRNTHLKKEGQVKTELKSVSNSKKDEEKRREGKIKIYTGEAPQIQVNQNINGSFYIKNISRKDCIEIKKTIKIYYNKNNIRNICRTDIILIIYIIFIILISTINNESSVPNITLRMKSMLKRK